MSTILNQVSEHLPVTAFWPKQRVDVEEISDGLVHNTYLIKVGEKRYILQRVNTFVFKEADKVISNIQVVTAHLQKVPFFHLKVPVLKPSKDGALSYEAPDGGLWRCFHYIEGFTRSSLSDHRDAFAVASAFGQFSAALSSLPPGSLHYTIVGFHDPQLREAQFKEALISGLPERIARCQPEIAKIQRYRSIADEIATLDLPLKVVHNDPKLSNVLFNADGKPHSIIDLDTVMPGSPLNDFGDLVRSMAASVPEDHEQLSDVFLNYKIYQFLEKGFLEGAAGTLSEVESTHLKTGAAYIIFEQAMRFLADHLMGDIYYRIKNPDHNLVRARNQITLLESFLQQVY